MRFQIVFSFVLSFFLLPALSFAAAETPKELPALMELSKTARAEALKENDFQNKSAKLKDFEKTVNSILEAYEKLTPEEGGNAEEQVAKFSFSLEPVLKLASGKKPSVKECEKAKHQVEFEDKGSRGEDAKLTADAEEALEWASVFCKP